MQREAARDCEKRYEEADPPGWATASASHPPLLKIPVWWRRAVLPSLPWVVCFLSFFLFARHRVRDLKRIQRKQLPLSAHRLDTGANWRVLVLSPAHHRSRLSDSCEGGEALSSVHPPGKKKKENSQPKGGWEDGTPPPHRDFKERSVVLAVAHPNAWASKIIGKTISFRLRGLVTFFLTPPCVAGQCQRL